MGGPMDWLAIEAQSLATIDREIGKHKFSPAEYEIIRRIICETADFDYKESIFFSDRALQAGAAAIAARTTIVVDVPMVYAGVMPFLQRTFANPIYCGLHALVRPQPEIPPEVAGIQTLARRYPEGIFAIGREQRSLAALLELVQKQVVHPALIISTTPELLGAEVMRRKLVSSELPNIHTTERKGGVAIAVAILSSLIDLAWQAYQPEIR